MCIVGAGVMGSATAYLLSRTPRLKVVMMDQYGVNNEYCSSNDANRVFRYAYGKDTVYTRMAVESLKLWEELEKETGQTLLVPTGLLLLNGESPEASKFNEDSYRTLSEMGLGAEAIGGAELGRRYPKFTAPDAYVDTHGGVLLATRIVSVLAGEAQKRGVRILEKRKATRLNVENQPTVETSTGEAVRCGKVIVTAGSWSNQLLGKNLPSMTPTRQQTVYFAPKANPEQFRPPEFPVFFVDQYYGLPAVGTDRVKVSHKNLWDPVDPDKADRLVSQEFVEASRAHCQRYIPELAEAEATDTKVCLYDMTKNSDFVIGEDPEQKRLFYGYGFSGHGFKFAPLIGKTLAELALGKPVSFYNERFSPASPHETPAYGPPY